MRGEKMEFLLHPRTVVQMAEEVKKACDSYWARQISEEELKRLVHQWARNEGDKLLRGDDYNPSVKKIIGKKRLQLVEKMMKGFQVKLK